MGAKAEIVLVLGGARSGKSEFAETYVLHAGTCCGYVATAEILDEEMRERVRLHRERRGKRWLTFEAPYHAETVLPEAGQRTDAILFDDIFTPKNKTIKTYLWNQGKRPLEMNRLSYYVTRKDPVLTGLYEPLH